MQTPELAVPGERRARACSPLALASIDASPPPFEVAMPDGTTRQLPGHLWPTASYQAANHAARQPRWRQRTPLISVVEITKGEASDLLIDFAHPMHRPTSEFPAGQPYRRGFCFRAWALVVGSEAAAVMVSADPSGPVIDKATGLTRRNTVDLARIARSEDPRHGNCLRAALRLWREYLAVTHVEYTRVVDELAAAVTFSLPGKAGSLYRADGWRKLRDRKPSRGGGGWSNRSRVAHLADAGYEIGTWVWRYPQPHRLDDAAPAPDGQLTLAA